MISRLRFQVQLAMWLFTFTAGLWLLGGSLLLWQNIVFWGFGGIAIALLQFLAVGIVQMMTVTLDKLCHQQLDHDKAASLLTPACREMRRLLDALFDSLGEHNAAVREAAEQIESHEAHQGVTDSSIFRLARSARENTENIEHFMKASQEVSQNVHQLAANVSDTTTAIESITFSSREIEKNIQQLVTVTQETAASINLMDVSISQVENNATETTKISQTVSHDAEIGVAAIKKTMLGIDKIRESSRVAADVIRDLGRRISDVGTILNVIDEVAEQTNLLALNAAIIAAQAGEHGRGFAIVADEIKALAERTGSSTKEIADLVKTIQDQSHRATDVMSQGVEDVDEGVRLSHNAQEALRKIVDSAKQATLMIQAIANATVEQALGSKQVTNAIGRIAETVQHIAVTTIEQAKSSEQIIHTVNTVRNITHKVKHAVVEQSSNSERLTQGNAEICELTVALTKSQELTNTWHASSQQKVNLLRDKAYNGVQLVNSAKGHLSALQQAWLINDNQ